MKSAILLLFCLTHLKAQNLLNIPFEEKLPYSKSKTKRIKKRFSTQFLEEVKNYLSPADIFFDLTERKLFSFIERTDEIQSRLKKCDETWPSCKRKTFLQSLDFLRVHSVIDSMSYYHLKNFLKKGKSDFSQYILSLNSLQRRFRKYRPENQDVKIHSPLERKNFYRHYDGFKGKLSPRQALYLRYDYLQIKKMAEIMTEANQNILAMKSGIGFDDDGDGVWERVYPTPEGENYIDACIVYKRTLGHYTKPSEILKGKSPTNLDMLTAALESGMINEDLLISLMKSETFKVPKIDKLKAWKDSSLRIGKFLLLSSSTIGLYAILPIVLIESYSEGIKQRDKDRLPINCH